MWSMETIIACLLTTPPASFPAPVSAHAGCFPHAYLASLCSLAFVLVFTQPGLPSFSTWQSTLILYFKVNSILLRKNYTVSPGHSIPSSFKTCHLGAFSEPSPPRWNQITSLSLLPFFLFAVSLSTCVPIMPTGLWGHEVRGYGIFISAPDASD